MLQLLCLGANTKWEKGGHWKGRFPQEWRMACQQGVDPAAVGLPLLCLAGLRPPQLG